MSVTRIFVEKKPGFDVEAKHIQTDLTENLGIRGIEELRLLHRYDVEGLSQKEQEDANRMIFSEPNVDHLYGEDLQFSDDYHVFAMEYLPGQYDQRADKRGHQPRLGARHGLYHQQLQTLWRTQPPTGEEQGKEG